ncbi:MAG: hypothetical protein KDB61_01410 [Planctomycetes bacterium]|nr:hypothetical protein [Planctomycetota bacterium]
MNEGRTKLIAKVPPELWEWAKRECLERQLRGERIEVRPGKTRDFDMGDLVAEALAMLKKANGKQAGPHKR